MRTHYLVYRQGTSQNRKPTVIPVRAYTVVDTLNELEAKALAYTQAYKFLQVKTKSVTVTLLEGISYTLRVRQ